MPGFSYVAVDAAGKEVKGSMEADDKERVAEQLRKDGLLPMSIREQGIMNKNIDFSVGRKVKSRDLCVFCRQFVSITEAGVPMKEALQMLSEQTENKWLKSAISEVLVNVERCLMVPLPNIRIVWEIRFPLRRHIGSGISWQWSRTRISMAAVTANPMWWYGIAWPTIHCIINHRMM